MQNRNDKEKQKLDQQKQETFELEKLARKKPKTNCKVCLQLGKLECTCLPKKVGADDSEEAFDFVLATKAKEEETTPVDTYEATKATPIEKVKQKDVSAKWLNHLHRFDPEVITKLLRSSRLFIDNQSDKGILTIRALPHLIKDKMEKRELEKYIEAILTTLEAFRREKNIQSSAHQVERNATGEFVLLRIMLAPGFYNDFIILLGKEALLPKENVEQKPGQKVTYPSVGDLFNRPSAAPKPVPGQKRPLEEDELANQHKHTPLKTKCTRHR